MHSAHRHWFQRETLRVVVRVKKICLKCQNFSIATSSNYSENLKKISSKIFSLKIDCIYDYFPDICLKFLITQLFLKIFPKYRKNFFKVACFNSFLTVPLNFFRISKHISIFTEFWNKYCSVWLPCRLQKFLFKIFCPKRSPALGR